MRIIVYDIYAHESEVKHMAQKKMGRPPSGDKPMKDRIFVLVSDETKDRLAQCKKALGTTASDVVRKGIDMVFDGLEKK